MYCWNISGKRVWFLRAITPDNKNWRLRFSLSFPREHFLKRSENIIVFVPVHTGSAASGAKVRCACHYSKIKVACAPWNNSYGWRPSNWLTALEFSLFQKCGFAVLMLWPIVILARLSIANSLAYSLHRFQLLSGSRCFLTLCVNKERFWKYKGKLFPLSDVNNVVSASIWNNWIILSSMVRHWWFSYQQNNGG